jgi:hypothetical protein
MGAILKARYKKRILRLYPKYDSVLGPYKRPDGRYHIVLNNSEAARGTKGKTKTISYPKAVMEAHLQRRLEYHETVDHKDDDHTNNRFSNFQVLTRIENARKEMRREHRSAKYKKRKCVECRRKFNVNVRLPTEHCSRKCTGKSNQRKMKTFRGGHINVNHK